MKRLSLVLLLVVSSALAGCGKNKVTAVDSTVTQQNAGNESLRPPDDAAAQGAAPQAESAMTASQSNDEIAAIIKAIGGDAIRDAEKPSQPVVSISFSRLPGSQDSHLDLQRLTKLTLPELDSLMIVGVSVTEADLADLKNFPKLTSLTLTGSALTDRGFEDIAKLGNLVYLGFTGTSLSDRGLDHSDALTKIEYLDLSRNKGVTDAGLVHLKRLDTLKELYLDGTSVTDAGLVHLAALTELRVLSLNQTRVTDAGLAHLLGLRKLVMLQLMETAVSAGGLTQLKQLSSLQQVNHSPSGVVEYREPAVEPPSSKQADRLEEVISWLPADTETVLVARGPFTVADTNISTHQSVAAFLQQRLTWLWLAELRDRSYSSDLEGAQIGLVVEGARRFRQPTAAGGFLFEGCRIFIFEDDLADKGDRLFDNIFRDASATEEIASHKVAQFQEQGEQDTQTIFVMRPAPNIIVEATDRSYLQEVLVRMKRKDTTRPALLDLPAWKMLDQAARYWMVRTYAKPPGNDITSPFFEGSLTADPKAKALGFAFPKDAAKSPVVLYFSDNDDAQRIAKKSWGEKAKVERLEAGVIAISYPIENVKDLGEFVLALFWHFGHGFYI